MVTNISVLSQSASVYISVGQYNQHTQTLELWYYRTRCKTENGDTIATFPDFSFDLCKQAKKVVLVDNDWDKRDEMTFQQFKRIKIENGVRKVNISKLSKK